jgi:hypothetical protein
LAKNSFISSFKKLPVAFLSSMVLFCATHALLVNSDAFWRFCYFYSNPMPDDGIRLEAQLNGISTSETRKKIFVTGSSQAREDVDVDYLNRRLKAADSVFYNFGISGNASPVEMLMLKDRLLAKNPDVIVYIPFVGSFYSRYNIQKMKCFFSPVILPDMVRVLGVKQIMADPHVRTAFVDSFLGTLTVFYRHRESVQRITRNALVHYARIERRKAVKRYAYKKNMPPTYFQSEIKRAGGRKYKRSAYTNFNENLFVRFARGIASKKVKLIVVSGPVHPLITQCYPEQIDAAYHRFLAEQAGKIGYVYLGQSDLPSFTAQEFIDFTHLNAAGRGRLSEFFKNYFSERDNPMNIERPTSNFEWEKMKKQK